MYTVSHAFWTYFFTRRSALKWFAVVGSIIPDFSIIYAAIVLGLQGQFSPFKTWLPQLWAHSWVRFNDYSMHSIPLWGVLGLIAVITRAKPLLYFVAGVGGHLGVDWLTHRRYAEAYFWPLSAKIYHGPLDYQQLPFMAVELTLIIIALIAIWKKRSLF